MSPEERLARVAADIGDAPSAIFIIGLWVGAFAFYLLMTRKEK